MSFVDAQAEFSVAQALTAAGTVQATNVYDTGAAVGIGEGYAVKVVANAVEPFVGGTSVQVQLTHADTAAGPFTVLASGPVKTTAEIAANRQIAAFAVPHGAKRVLGLQYVVAGTFTGGKVSAGLQLDAPGNIKGTPSGIPAL